MGGARPHHRAQPCVPCPAEPLRLLPPPLLPRRAGLSFGQLLAPNLMLLFLPVPHTGLVPWLTGIGRNHLVRYHRWCGHGTMWILTAHAVLYYVYWGTSDVAGG